MTTDELIDLAHKAGTPAITRYGLAVVTMKWMENFAELVAAAERKVIMDSLQKQADLATDALDRRWALEMIAAVAARSNT